MNMYSFSRLIFLYTLKALNNQLSKRISIRQYFWLELQAIQTEILLS